MSDIYNDGQYAEDNPTWHEEDSPFKADRVMRMMRANGLSPASIAEIGCGVGGILKELHSAMPDTTTFKGFDIAQDAIARARQKHACDRLDYVAQDLLETDERFDLLLIMDVIEHIPDFYGFTRRCKDHAEYKLFHIPLEINVSTVLRGKVNVGLAPFGHIHYFSTQTALSSLEQAGHEVVDYMHTNGAIATAHLHPSMGRTIVNIPRRIVGAFSEPLSARLFGGYSLLVLTR